MKKIKMIILNLLIVISFGIFTPDNAHAVKVEKEDQHMFDFDKDHMSILFFIEHVGFSKTVGQFTKFDGYFVFDKEHPEKSFVTITIDPTSIDMAAKVLNTELQGDKFFDTAKNGNIKFESTKVEVTGEKTGKLTGNLTLHGVTKPVTFDVTFNKQDNFFGFIKAGFSLKGKIKRTDFGMDWGVPDMLSDEVEILVEAEGTKRQLN